MSDPTAPESSPAGFTIWIDADACPREARELAIASAVRRRIHVVFVANAWQRLPESEFISFRLAPVGADKADDLIVENAGGSDLAVTGDIPLAFRLVAKNLLVLDPRGDEITDANIGERLAMRNLMDKMRSAGLPTGGPREFSRADRQRFANALDRAINQRRKDGTSRKQLSK
ncbi:MAG: YaiI/YqxD family protein [Planctomycetota bacterium]|jgi:uncharacterized protein YaiI (UPF0178 family)|nr:YaiI/YqxD family protein [Planctomycetota bacterium]